MTSGVTAISSSVTGLYVGTSGWSYPSWKPGFYPPETKPAEFLRYYAERLPSVELNTTGYRLPAEGQFERWAAATPPGFRFAPKLNAYRLSDFATFEERTGLLGDRLGPIRVLVGSARDEGFLQRARLDRPTASDRVRLPTTPWAGIETSLPGNAVRVNDLEAGPVPLPPAREHAPYSDAEAARMGRSDPAPRRRRSRGSLLFPS